MKLLAIGWFMIVVRLHEQGMVMMMMVTIEKGDKNSGFTMIFPFSCGDDGGDVDDESPRPKVLLSLFGFPDFLRAALDSASWVFPNKSIRLDGTAGNFMVF